MKKKTILNSTFAVLILLLSGCGDKGTGALNDPSIEPAEEATAVIVMEESSIA